MEIATTLQQTTANLALFLPELALIGGILLLLFVDLFSKESIHGWYPYLTSLLLFISIILTARQACPCLGERELFSSMLTLNRNTAVLKIILQSCTIGSIIFIIADDKKPTLYSQNSIFYVLILSILLGGHLVVMSQNLLITFIGIELISLCSYLLVATDKTNSLGLEASLKYLIFGAVASALMLYGMSWLYGLNGDLQYDGLTTYFTTHTHWFYYLIFVFVLLGFLFKLAATPMHSWIPDIYQGAPNVVITLLSVLPKLAAVYLLFTFSALASDDAINQLLLVLAITSVCIGNLGAFWQQNVKRLLAYSSIAHAGFLLLGVTVGGTYGLQTIYFYSILLLLTNLGIFFILEQLKTKNYELDSYAGLGKQFPLIGVASIVLMAAFIGLPPTMGFSGKLFLFSGLWNTYKTTADSLVLWIFVIGLLNTVLALFYYIKLPYYLFFKENGGEQTNTTPLTLSNKFFILLITFSLLVFFVKADWLFNIL
ncbi:MAG: NADH-quinone oxidoreductase subunit N [Cyclobacteriaceae bacterium]